MSGTKKSAASILKGNFELPGLLPSDNSEYDGAHFQNDIYEFKTLHMEIFPCEVNQSPQKRILAVILDSAIDSMERTQKKNLINCCLTATLTSNT